MTTASSVSHIALGFCALYNGDSGAEIMAVVINPNNEDNCQLSPEEARAFFGTAVQEQFGVTAEEFLRRRDEFKANPHYDSIMFLLSLVENVQE